MVESSLPSRTVITSTRTWAALGCLLVVSLGCGPAAAPESPKNEWVEPAPSSPAAASSGAAPSAERASDPMGPVLQAAIDAPQLEPYWHVAERAERSPLVLVRFPALQGEPALTKFGKPVEYASHADVASRPHLEVQAIAIKPDRATVVFGYPVEGVVAHVFLVRETGAWVVAKADVVEH